MKDWRRERNNNGEEQFVLVKSNSFSRVKQLKRNNGNSVNILSGEGDLCIF